MSRRLLAALGAGLVLLAGCTSGGTDTDEAASSSSAPSLGSADTDLLPCPEQTGTPAADTDLPKAELPCFNGGTLDLAKAPGVPMVVNFWASWCGPCREELPEMQQLADAAGDRVRVVGVVSKDGVKQSSSFASDAGTTFPSAFDGEGDLLAHFGVKGLPNTLFITADGKLAYTKIGKVASLADLEALVDQHLGVQL